MKDTNKRGYSVLVKQTKTDGTGKRKVDHFNWEFTENQYEESAARFKQELSEWSKHAGQIMYTKLSYTIQHITHHIDGFNRKVTISNNIN